MDGWLDFKVVREAELRRSGEKRFPEPGRRVSSGPAETGRGSALKE